MLVEIIRVLAIDIALILSLILILRSGRSYRGRLMLLTGLCLLLAEDGIRFVCGIAIGYVDANSQHMVDLVRQWVSLVGAIGAVLACLALLRLVLTARPVGREKLV